MAAISFWECLRSINTISGFILRNDFGKYFSPSKTPTQHSTADIQKKGKKSKQDGCLFKYWIYPNQSAYRSFCVNKQRASSMSLAYPWCHFLILCCIIQFLSSQMHSLIWVHIINKAKNSKKLEGVSVMLQQFCGRVTTVHVRGDSVWAEQLRLITCLNELCEMETRSWQLSCLRPSQNDLLWGMLKRYRGCRYECTHAARVALHPHRNDLSREAGMQIGSRRDWTAS